MNIMNQLTKKHMQKNKKRTIMTILGVIVSVAMITAVATATNTFKIYFQQLQMQRSGNWHIKYDDVSYDKKEILEKDSNTKNVFYLQDNLYGRFIKNKTNNEIKPYLSVQAFTKEAMEEMHLELKAGRLPEREGEIALSSYLKLEDGTTFKTGDTITLEVGHRYRDTYDENLVLDQGTPYNYNEIKEKFHVIETKNYTVTGIIDYPGFEDYDMAGYTSITYFDPEKSETSPKVDAYVYLNKVSNHIYKQSKNLAKKLGLPENEVGYNNGVLAYYGVSKSDTFNKTMIMLEGILIVIIMIGSVSLIYNSFAISITERNKQLGMLSSVGATKKQKRNAVFYEGGIIGAIAIPIGVLAGIGGMGITFSIVGPIFAENTMRKVPLEMHVSIESILVAVIFSIITIFISAYLPAHRASKISAIEAIRQTQDIKIKKKSVRTRKWVRAVFGLEGELALKNLKRNKKRFRALVFSLFISLVLFISVSSYVFYVSKGAEMVKGNSKYDAMILFYDGEPEKDLLERLRGVDGVAQLVSLKSFQANFFVDQDYAKKHTLQYYIETERKLYELYGHTKEEIDQMMDQNKAYPVKFVVLDDKTYAAYAKKVGVVPDKKKDAISAILINQYSMQIGYSVLESDLYDTKTGDVIPIYYQMNEETKGNKKENIPISICGVTENLPMNYMISAIGDSVVLVVNKEEIESILSFMPKDEELYTNTSYLFEIDNDEGIDDRIRTVLKETQTNYGYCNVLKEARQNRQMLFVLSVFAYGFITLISFVCIANLCNTISTSFILRRREFAMLKSVGMTPKAFRKMIRYESLFYGVKAILYGIPVSVLITIRIYKAVNSSFMSEFRFPWSTYVIGIVAIFVVVCVAMGYAGRKIKSETIIDGLKSER